MWFRGWLWRLFIDKDLHRGQLFPAGLEVALENVSMGLFLHSFQRLSRLYAPIDLPLLKFSKAGHGTCNQLSGTTKAPPDAESFTGSFTTAA